MQVVLKSQQLQVTINSYGAQLCSVRDKKNTEFIWQADKSIWPRHAPVLFPIVGKLNNNFYTYDGKSYELPQHGFARNAEFTLISSNNLFCLFELKSNQHTQKFFPFEFTFQIHYELKQSTLITNYYVLNADNKPIFFSVGAHPGLNCPLLPEENFEDYFLEFEKEQLNLTTLNEGLRLNEFKKLVLNNCKLQLNKSLFENDALVFENNQIQKISLCSSKSKYKITLECKNWPYFGVWAKKNTEKFVCLEPWQGIADSITHTNELMHKEGIIRLNTNERFNCNYSLSFSS